MRTASGFLETLAFGRYDFHDLGHSPIVGGCAAASCRLNFTANSQLADHR
jgi:hypothetical protein